MRLSQDRSESTIRFTHEEHQIPLVLRRVEANPGQAADDDNFGPHSLSIMMELKSLSLRAFEHKQHLKLCSNSNYRHWWVHIANNGSFTGVT
jgi:hypothetical protein